jgi:exportin-7
MNHPPNFRLRTKFYLTWARMVFSEHHIDYFDELMEPFDQNMRNLYQLSISNVTGADSDIKLHLVGFARDMRGVLMAIYNKNGFQLFYDWFFPEYFKVIINCFQRFLADPDVTIPVLKLFAEIAHNKAQRIEFSSSSPNGIILFKDISQVLYGYASSIGSLMQRSDPNLIYNIQKDPYRYFLKSLSLSMEALSHALRGCYVNFGIFPLYGDDCLSKALSSIIELTFCQAHLTRQITVNYGGFFSIINIFFRHLIKWRIDIINFWKLCFEIISIRWLN